MKNAPDFVSSFATTAIQLLESGAVRDPLFSRGTYQFEVKDGKKLYYPFLAVSDEGIVGDAFCSCQVSESGHGCPHLAAAYLQVFHGHEIPLHVRFAESFWNQLFQMAAKLIGYETSCLKNDGTGKYICSSKAGHILFTVHATGVTAQKQLAQLIDDRVVETEETSLKFFNLSPEEMALYKKGTPSHQLQYELSVWSDLAKWAMFLVEEGSAYEISFGNQADLPKEIAIDFPKIHFWFALPTVHLPDIIPSLQQVVSPLKVYGDLDQQIEQITYDPKAKSLNFKRDEALNDAHKGIAVGDWVFVRGEGFYRHKLDPLFDEGVIGPEKMAQALSSKSLAKYLNVSPNSVPAKYQLWIDEAENLHVALYVQDPDDMSGDTAALFPPFAYTKSKVFYPLTELLFEEIETIIPKDQVPEFINQHRLWLNNFPGFQIHLGSLEAHLTYFLSSESTLSFEAELNFPELFEESIDFQE